MKYFEVLGGLLLHPREYIRILSLEGGSLGEALFTLAFFNSMSIITSTSIFFTLISPFRQMFTVASIPIRISNLFNISVGLAIFIGIITSLIIWLIWGFLTHIFAKILGGEGDVEHLLIAYGYNYFPLFLEIIPSVLALKSVILALEVMLITAIISFIWIVYLNTLATSEIYGISGFRAFCSVFILPLLVIFIFIIVVSILALLALPTVPPITRIWG